jgi:DNA (cytosine-5)-methyltransferase 1
MERMPMTFGSLFAGIGGFDLGLERAGMTCKWQVEIDDYASRVLAKHWPDVPRHGDVRTFPTADRDWSVDLICGGFPCQDISLAGKGAGLAGARSGLWYEFARILGNIRPRWAVIENVPALTSRGLDTVLCDLASLGFDAEWHVIPASAVGAPHRRDRIWIVAHSQGINRRTGLRKNARPRSQTSGCWIEPRNYGCNVADADSPRLEKWQRQDTVGAGPLSWGESRGSEWWATEPDVGRVAHGVPARVDRLRGLGNAVVPQVVEVIGRAIIEAEAQVADRR